MEAVCRPFGRRLQILIGIKTMHISFALQPKYQETTNEQNEPPTEIERAIKVAPNDFPPFFCKSSQPTYDNGSVAPP